MCVSFGLDPHFYSEAKARAAEHALNDLYQRWVDEVDENDIGNAWPSRPTAKNTYPIITQQGVEQGWWGHLVDGKPAKYFSINARSERFEKKPPARRGIVPASWFFERDAGNRWHRYGNGPASGVGAGSEPLFMAATVQPGVLATGEAFTCYSILTQDPPPHLAAIHDRTVALVPLDGIDEWLNSSDAGLMRKVVSESWELQQAFAPELLDGKPA